MTGNRSSAKEMLESGSRSLVLITLLAWVSMGTVWAGNNAWTSLGPKDGSITALAIDPQNTKVLYAGTSEGRMFKSADGGANWTALNPGFEGPYKISALAIDPKATGILFAGTNGGVFKSKDAGNSWSLVNSGIKNSDIAALAIDPRNQNTLYVGTWGDGVYKTTDAGIKWIPGERGLDLSLRLLPSG